ATAVTTPPQLLATGGTSGLALNSPAGYASATATPPSASGGCGCWMVTVSSDVAPTRIGLVPNVLVMVGGCSAVNVATAEPVAVVFVPPSIDETKPLTLVCGPAVVAVTLTLTVHVAPPAIVAPVTCPKSSVVPPAAGAQVGEPVHVVLAAGTAATCVPAGRLSVNLTPVTAVVAGL